MKLLRIEFSLLALAVLALVSCGPKDEDVSVYDNPPVGMLVSNDHQITIHTGPEGPLYSVKGPDGTQLATEISKQELQASFPNLNMSEIWAEVSLPVPRSASEFPGRPVR